MSGRGNDSPGQNSNQGTQGGQAQGGQGQHQGGQAQGGQGQHQAGQGQHQAGQARGQRHHAQQGQAPHQGGHGPSITDYATNGVTKAYAKFFAATFALVGAAAGVAVILVGVVGGAPIAPDLPVNPSDFINNYGAIKNQYYTNRLAYQTMNAMPVAAALLGVAGGIYVGKSVDGPDEQAYAAGGIGTFAGAFLLVFLGGLLASFAISSIPIPEASDSAQAMAGSTSTQQLQQAEGVASAVLIGGTKLEFGGLLINALLTAIATGALAVGGVYVSRNLDPAN